jgi:cobalt transporter subunit CbtA
MTKVLLSSGLLAGAATGLVVALLQLFLIQPLIIEAERYETGVMVLPGPEAVAPDRAPDHGNIEASVKSGLTRGALTVLFLTLTWSGFGLLAAAGVATAQLVAPDRPITVLGIAIAGFATAALAPALGLPPELPGMPAADIEARRIWWIWSGLAMLAALTLAFRFRSFGARFVSFAVAASPHVFGAPSAPLAVATIPPDLAALYVSRVLGVSFFGWLVMAIVLQRLSAGSAKGLALRPMSG